MGREEHEWGQVRLLSFNLFPRTLPPYSGSDSLTLVAALEPISHIRIYEPEVWHVASEPSTSLYPK